MKILHIINSLTPGGAEILLCNSLSSGGLCEFAENHVAYYYGISFPAERIDPRVPVHDLGYTGISDIPALTGRIRKLVKKHRFDVVHTHLNPAGLYTHFALRGMVPQVHTMHSTYSMDTQTGTFKKWLETNGYLLRKNTNLIFLSEFAQADFLSTMRFRGRSFVLNNFVEDRFFTDSMRTPYEAGRPLKFVAAGTLKPLKNFEYLIAVFSLLKNVDISVDVYGHGNAEPFEAQARASGASVRFCGGVRDMQEVLGRYDAFIMPSIFEGAPLAALEAMAAGLPVLLSDIPPLKSYIGNNAIYFPLHDPQTVADIILKIFNGEIALSAYAERGNIFAKATSRRERYVGQLLDLYRNL